MITLATFFGYIITSFLIAWLIGFSINGLFSLFKNIR